MWLQTAKSIERKEAINTKLSKEEKEAIDIIRKETDKTQIEWLIKKTFNVPEGEKNIETKNALKFLYEAMIDQIYVLYKTNKNQDIWRDDKTGLESAFFFMKLFNPDAYANESWLFQSTYVTWEKKDLFYSAVEKEMGEIFEHPSVLYQKFNIEDRIVDKNEYEQNKDKFVKEWRKIKSEKTVEWIPEKILADGESITFPKQYFYRWKSDIDIDKWIKDIVPSMKAEIGKLKKNPNIDPTSVQLEVTGSVSNIRYPGNKALLWNRSYYMQSKLEWLFDGTSVTISNPEYSGYWPERWPSYPPAVEALNAIFSPWSEALNALDKIWFTAMEEVVKSMTDQWSNSKYFDVLEQYMYRDYQYAEAKVTYQGRKEVPTGRQILELQKSKEKPDLNDGMITRKTGQIIAKNPYYEKQTSLAHKYKKINGVTFPVSEEYIALQLSDNKLLEPTLRYGISALEYSQKSGHTITNTEYKERKHGKWARTSEELNLNLDKDGVDLFTITIIKNDEDRWRSITNKEKGKIIEQYITNPKNES